METLSKQQIDFIDHYLEHSGIQFSDVRLELTDHVASELEEKLNGSETDFYNAFKNYMAIHKRELLKSEKHFKKEMDKKLGLQILKNALKPEILLIAAFLFFGYRQLDFLYSVDFTGTWLWILTIYALIVGLLFYIGKYRKLLGMQRLAYQYNWFSGYPLLFIKPYLTYMSVGDQVFMAIMILINVSLFYTGIKMHRDYRHNYQLS